MTDALAILAHRWGAHEGTISRVDRATQIVARFQTDAGVVYLRITPASTRSLSVVAGALDWHRHLYEAGAPVVEPLRSSDGFWIEMASIEPITAVAIATRGAPGRPVNFDDPVEIRAWAEAVGRVHAASKSYTPSPVSTRTGPVEGKLPTLGDHWTEIEPTIATDPSVRAHYAESSRYLARLPQPHLVTHGDVRPENALISDDRVVLLDFDEPTWAWPTYDLARMILNDDASPPRDRSAHLAAIMTGYRQSMPMFSCTSDDLDAFLRIRALLMYGWSLQDHFDDATWLRRLREIIDQAGLARPPPLRL